MMNQSTIEKILNLPSVQNELDALAAGEFEERRTQIESVLDADESFKTRVSLAKVSEAKLRIKEIAAEESLKQINTEIATTRRAILDDAYTHKNFADLAWQSIESSSDPRLIRFAIWAGEAKNALQYYSHVRESFQARTYGIEQRHREVRTAVNLCNDAMSWALAARREALSHDDVTFKIASFVESIANAAPDANIPRFDVEV